MDATVSIIIPTLNEVVQLEKCLDSIFNQNYDKIDLYIVDGHSMDGTIDLIKRYGVGFSLSNSKPLGARYEGLKNTQSKYVLFMDADQYFTKRTAISELVAEIEKGFDAIIMGEVSSNPINLCQIMLMKERKEINSVFNDLSGTDLHPRFFRREAIIKAYSSIPSHIYANIFYYDDFLLHSELNNLNCKYSFIEQIIHHNEESNFIALAKHWIKFGKSAYDFSSECKRNQILINTSIPDKYDVIKKRLKNGTFFIGLYKYFFFILGYNCKKWVCPDLNRRL